MDLFKILVPAEKLHHNFMEIAKEKNGSIRELFSSWADGFLDRHGKFGIEFQTTFNSSFWELYLFNVLKKWQIRPDLSFDRPDFVCKEYGGFSIEAVIASNAQNDKPEWERDYSELPEANFIEELVKKASIRLSSAITSKFRKYTSEYTRLNHVKYKPFIIALAPFEQPFFWEQSLSAIMQVLYGIKRIRYVNDEENNTRKVLGIDFVESIEKENGSEIEVSYFNKNPISEISAVIFNNCATMGKLRALTKHVDSRKMLFKFSKFNKDGLHPTEGVLEKEQYTEEIEDGLNIFLNPYAKHPVPKEFLSHFPSINYFDLNDQTILSNTKNGALFKRMVTVLDTY